MGGKLSLRIATADDLPRIMDLAREICEENGFLRANLALLASEFWPALHADHGICAVIGAPGQAIEGLVLLRIGTMWYSDEVVLEEKVLCVGGQYRAAKGGRARALCEFSKETADSLGLPLLIGILSQGRRAAKVRLYTRQFGEPAGAFFLYRATTGGHGFTEH
jgi:hypothetical protein